MKLRNCVRCDIRRNIYAKIFHYIENKIYSYEFIFYTHTSVVWLFVTLYSRLFSRTIKLSVKLSTLYEQLLLCTSLYSCSLYITQQPAFTILTCKPASITLAFKRNNSIAPLKNCLLRYPLLFRL